MIKTGVFCLKTHFLGQNGGFWRLYTPKMAIFGTFSTLRTWPAGTPTQGIGPVPPDPHPEHRPSTTGPGHRPIPPVGHQTCHLPVSEELRPDVGRDVGGRGGGRGASALDARSHGRPASVGGQRAQQRQRRRGPSHALAAMGIPTFRAENTARWSVADLQPCPTLHGRSGWGGWGVCCSEPCPLPAPRRRSRRAGSARAARADCALGSG